MRSPLNYGLLLPLKTNKMKFCGISGKRGVLWVRTWCFWEQNLSLSFYLSLGKWGEQFPLHKQLTTVFNTEMHPFILIRDARLAIDYHSYGNLSDQLNLRFHSLPLDLIILQCISLKFFGDRRGTCCGYIRSRVERVAKVYNMWPLTAADKSSEWWCRARGFIAVSERGRWCCSLPSPSVLW